MNILNKFRASRKTVCSEYAKVNAKPFVRSAIQAIVMVVDLVIMFVLIWNMFTYFIPQGSWINIVNGNSMYPTMHSGQVIYTDANAEFSRGDVVTVHMTENFASQYPEYVGMIMVKRIVGVPGDRLIIDETGNVYINGELLIEDYLTNEAKSFTYREGMCNSVLLDDDEYFLMGDNRKVSCDSRSFGVVNREDMMYKQSEAPTRNFWQKLVVILFVFVLNVFLYSLVEFVLTECVYWMIYGKKIRQSPQNNSDCAEFNNVVKTTETVILKGDNT